MRLIQPWCPNPSEVKRTDSGLLDSSYRTSLFVQIDAPTPNDRSTPGEVRADQAGQAGQAAQANPIRRFRSFLYRPVARLVVGVSIRVRILSGLLLRNWAP